MTRSNRTVRRFHISWKKNIGILLLVLVLGIAAAYFGGLFAIIEIRGPTLYYTFGDHAGEEDYNWLTSGSGCTQLWRFVSIRGTKSGNPYYRSCVVGGDAQMGDIVIHMEKSDWYYYQTGCQPVSEPVNIASRTNYCCNCKNDGYPTYKNIKVIANGTDKYGCPYKTYEYYSAAREYKSSSTCPPSGAWYCEGCGTSRATRKGTPTYSREETTSGGMGWKHARSCGYKYKIYNIKTGEVLTEQTDQFLRGSPTATICNTPYKFDGITGYCVYEKSCTEDEDCPIVEKDWRGGCIKQPSGGTRCQYYIYSAKEKLQLGDLSVKIMTDENYENYDCNYIESTIDIIIPKDAFNFTVEPTKSYYFAGEEAQIRVTVDNRWKAVNALLHTKVCQPTFGGEYCKTMDKEVDLARGENVVYFTIPTGLVVEKLTVTPSMDLRIDPVTYPIKNVNVRCAEYADGKTVSTRSVIASLCKWVDIGSYQGDTQTVMINPKPIYVLIDCKTNPCPSGYSCQTDSGLCLRTDIIEKNISCFSIPCPPSYTCTSAGICAETLYVYKDCTTTPCPEGTTCDAASGLCIKTEIFKYAVQCTTGADCIIPCEGVTASCFENRCIYAGQCKPLVVQCFSAADCPSTPCMGVTKSCENSVCKYTGSCEPVYIKLDCSMPENPCPESYECDKSMSPAACRQTIYKSLDCRDLGCPSQYACEQQLSLAGFWSTYVCTKTATVYVDIDCRSPGKTCPEGYTCVDASNSQQTAGLCTKTEYVMQSCIERGCPSGYQCELDGGCTKSLTTYIIQDCNTRPCPSSYLCEPQSGLCTKAELIFQNCSTLSCPYGYDCLESGVCNRTIEKLTEIFVTMNCTAAPCPQDMTCAASGDFCVLTQYRQTSCKSVGCPLGYNCNEITNICQGESVRYIEKEWPLQRYLPAVIIVAVIVAGIGIVIALKRR